MRMSVFVGMAALVPGMFLMQASGGSSVAVIDFERAVNEAPGGKEALTQLNAFRNEQLTAIEKKRQEADDLATRLQTQSRTLSETTRTQLTKDLQAAQSSVETMADDAQKKLIQMQQEVLAPIQQKTVTAVATYANEHAVKIVLDASVLQNGLVYVHDTADITTEIIRRIAADLQQPPQMHAALPQQQRLLNRTWLDFSLRPNPSLNAD